MKKAPMLLFTLLAAQTLPDPNSYASIGWVAFILVMIVWGANQFLELLARGKSFGKTKTGVAMATDQVNRGEWQDHKEKTEASLKELQDDIKELLQRTAGDAGYGKR